MKHELFSNPLFAVFHDFRSIFRAWRLWGGGPVIILTALPKPEGAFLETCTSDFRVSRCTPPEFDGGFSAVRPFVSIACLVAPFVRVNFLRRVVRAFLAAPFVRVSFLRRGRSCQFHVWRRLSFVSISCGVVVRVNLLCRWAPFVRV